jgi:hypothetical protein
MGVLTNNRGEYRIRSMNWERFVSNSGRSSDF